MKKTPLSILFVGFCLFAGLFTLPLAAQQEGSPSSPNGISAMLKQKYHPFLLDSPFIALIRTCFIEAYKIPSLSMYPALRRGDHILVTKLSYGLQFPYMENSLWQFSSPKRGDVIVFTRPDDLETSEDESKVTLIKRVIGLPGETLQIKEDRVLINGKIIPEPYANWSEEELVDGNFGPVKIPDGRVFLLGDNRNRSKDSRHWDEPCIEISRIKGRAFLIYFSLEGLSRIGMVVE